MAASTPSKKAMPWPATAIDNPHGEILLAEPGAAAPVVVTEEEAREHLAGAAAVITTSEGLGYVKELVSQPPSSVPRLQALAGEWGCDGLPTLVLWVGEQASRMALTGPDGLVATVDVDEPLTMRGMWNRLLATNRGIAGWAKDRAEAEVNAEYERFLRLIRTGEMLSFAGGRWLRPPWGPEADGLAAFVKAAAAADTQDKARRLVLGGYAAGHLDLRRHVPPKYLVEPANPQDFGVFAVERLRQFALSSTKTLGDAGKEPVDVAALQARVRALAGLPGVMALKAASGVARGHTGLVSTITTVPPGLVYLDNLEATDALLKSNPVPGSVEERVTTLEAEAAVAAQYDPARYVGLLDEVRAARPKELANLIRDLGICEIAPEVGTPFVRGDQVDLAFTEGSAGDPYVKEIIAPGYEWKGRVLRKAQVKVELRRPTAPALKPAVVVAPAPLPSGELAPPHRPPVASLGRRLWSGFAGVALLVLALLGYRQCGAGDRLIEVAAMSAGSKVVRIMEIPQRSDLGVVREATPFEFQRFNQSGGQPVSVLSLNSALAAPLPDGTLATAGTGARRLELRDAASKRTVKMMGESNDQHNDSINAILFAHAINMLVSGSSDQTVKLWTPSNGAPNQSITAGGRVTALAFGGGSLFVGAQDEGRAWFQIWTAPDANKPAYFSQSYTQDVSSDAIGEPVDIGPYLAASAEGKTLAAASGKKVWIWNGQLQPAPGPTAQVSGVAISGDGKHLVAASGKSLWVWRLDASSDNIGPGKEYPAHNDLVTAVTCLPGTKRWASAARDGSIKVWEIR